jgi:hypothetical protein
MRGASSTGRNNGISVYLLNKFTLKGINFLTNKARVFRCDSPLTRSRRSIGSGGESYSMLTSVSYSVGGLVSVMFTHPMLSFKCRMADY